MLHGKFCFMDTETTGTDSKLHGVIEIAMIIEDRGGIVGEKAWKLAPFGVDEIDLKALEINKRTEIEIANFPNPIETWIEIAAWLRQFVNPYDRTDKLIPAGHGVGFDMNFLKALWEKADEKDGGKFFGSYFTWDKLDSLELCRWLKALRLLPRLANLKLGTLCDHFGIPLGGEAHGAIADIRATRTLIHRLVAEYMKEV